VAIAVFQIDSELNHRNFGIHQLWARAPSCWSATRFLVQILGGSKRLVCGLNIGLAWFCLQETSRGKRLVGSCTF